MLRCRSRSYQTIEMLFYKVHRAGTKVLQMLEILRMRSSRLCWYQRPRREDTPIAVEDMKNKLLICSRDSRARHIKVSCSWSARVAFKIQLTSLKFSSGNKPRNPLTKSSLDMHFSPFTSFVAYLLKISRNFSVDARLR